ncbi:MAG: beta-ketoacyl synthase chain length factor [Rubrivivax sp.]|nr:beta-ketoacyl synthase chain length factor [Rubrivivax sp.]
MTRVVVAGIGLVGPGLADWATGAALLRDPGGWVTAVTVVPAPNRLPPTERRRAGTVVKASLVAADQALAMSGADPATLPTVFTSSTGDPLNCHLLCEALATPERLVSPTRFTNSVHNAPAGYWHIATASRAPSTSLAAFDASFAAGLLEAAVQVQASGAPVLLVAADVPYPEPLHAKRPVADTFALALLLAPGNRGRTLTLQLTGDATATPCPHAGLEGVRRTIPAARALPLLMALAGNAAADVVIEGDTGWALSLTVGAST